MDLMQAGLALEKFIDIGSEARPADRDHARQAFRILCEAIRVANEENARVRDLAHRSDLPSDVVRGIERLREDLSAAVFAGREWKDKAQDKIAEVEKLESIVDSYVSMGPTNDEARQMALDALELEVESLRAEREHWREQVYSAEAQAKALFKFNDELRAEIDSLVAYLGETASAVENHNVKRQQIADLLRRTQEKLWDGAER